MARVTIEDCLKEENNRFRLVLAASKRARQITNGHQPLLPPENDKATVVALREIALDKASITGLLNERQAQSTVGTHSSEEEAAE